MYDREQVFFKLVLRLPGIPSSYGRLESKRGAHPLGCKYQLPEPPVSPWEPSPDPSSSPERKCSQGTGQKSFPTFIIISNPLSPGARHTDDVNWAVGLFPSLYLNHQERRKTLESKYILNYLAKSTWNTFNFTTIFWSTICFFYL